MTQMTDRPGLGMNAVTLWQQTQNVLVKY